MITKLFARCQLTVASIFVECRPPIYKSYSERCCVAKAFASFRGNADPKKGRKYQKLDPFDDAREHCKIVLSVANEHRMRSIEEWMDIERASLGIRWGKVSISESNFPGIILRECVKTKNYVAAKSLMQYVDHLDEDKGGADSRIGLRTLYMRMFSSAVGFDVEKEVLRTYLKLPKEAIISHPAAALDAIAGLSMTSRWEDGLKLCSSLDTLDPVHASSGRCYLAKRFFNEDQPEEGWDLLKQLDLGIVPRDVLNDVCLAWMSFCLRIRQKKPSGRRKALVSDAVENVSMIERLLEFLANGQQILSRDLAESIMNWYRTDPSTTWIVDECNINPASRACSACDRRLPLSELSDGDFFELRSKFLSQVLTGNDVYQRSTPLELERFRKFVENSAPFDLVVDGLNVFYASGTRNQEDGMKRLAKIVDYYAVGQRKRVAVIGRKHLTKNFSDTVKFIRKHSLFFTLDSLSSDDLFIVYTAMYSGQHCFILSRDLMKNHGAKLRGDRLRSLYNTWLRSRLIQFVDILPAGRLVYQPPCLHPMHVTKTDPNCWHLPVQPSPRNVSEWICIRPRSNIEQ